MPATFDAGSRLLNVSYGESAQLVGMAQTGQWLNLRHWVYDGNGVYAVLSRDVLVQRVTLFAAAGMGFRADLATGGLTAFRNVAVLRREGRGASIAADAVHFLSCAGEAEVSDSVFENHGDDGLNVHGQFELVSSLSTDLRTVTFGPGWQTVVTYAIGTPFRFRHRTTLEHLGDSVLLEVTYPGGGRIQASLPSAAQIRLAPDPSPADPTSCPLGSAP